MQKPNFQKGSFRLQRIIVTADFVDWRIDKFLASQLPTVSRMKIQKKIKMGLIIKNDKIVDIIAEKVQLGDLCIVRVNKIQQKKNKGENITPVNLKLDIVYEDRFLMVINKPTALTVHPGAGIDSSTLAHALRFHCGKNLANLDSDRPGIVHRLDRDTTGLMLIAKSDQVHGMLAAMIKARQVKREYKTVCYGNMKPLHGTINLPIARNEETRKTMQVNPEIGKPSVTHYQTLEVLKKNLASLLHCKLETGRTHQIRVHLSHLGCPIVGDKTYCKKKTIPMNRQALHAFYLAFEHPVSKKAMKFEKDMPKDMRHLLDLLESKYHKMQEMKKKLQTKKFQDSNFTKRRVKGFFDKKHNFMHGRNFDNHNLDIKINRFADKNISESSCRTIHSQTPQNPAFGEHISVDHSDDQSN